MFKKYSLLKQLMIILLSIVLLVICVVSPLINKNLNRLVSKQMYDIIDSSQENYLNNFYSPIDSGDSKQVYHIYVEISDSTLNWQSILPLNQTVAKSLMVNVFSFNIVNQKGDTQYYKINLDNDRLYYKIHRIEDSHYLVSFIYGDYSSELIHSILKELVYVQYIVLFIVAMVMVIWVGTLIKPLYQIENYINKIKSGENGTLNINRKDEIGQVSNALIEMKNELETQEALKEELMHNISHDLKTPIAVIKSYSESMLDDIYPYGTKESSLNVILENVERLEDKVKSFLYLNRLDYLKHDSLELEEVDMVMLVNKIKEQMDVNNELISIHLLNEKVCFTGIEEHWRNVIENIVDNAKRYCKEKIIITLDTNMIAIYNDGKAIDPELLQTIFNPYTKGEKGNFGLGLSIVKKVVDMFNYHIIVENINNGVQFKIYK